MTNKNPFLSPVQELAPKFDKLMAGLDVSRSRAHAEVAFRERQQNGHWDDQPVGGLDWNVAGLPPGLPGYWEAGIQYASTLIHGYAEEAARVDMTPTGFERLMNHCVDVVARRTYHNKLARYAKVKLPRLPFVLCIFTGEVRRVSRDRVEKVTLDVWRRHEAKIAARPGSMPPSTAVFPALEPEQVHGSDGASVSVPAHGKVEQSDKATRWEDIQIRFTSEHRVQITINQCNTVLTYEEMGFSDRRTSNPNLAWRMLCKMAENRGMLRDPQTAGASWTSVEKCIQTIRKKLRDRYGIEGDPVPYVEGTGYQARFVLSHSRGY